MDDQLISCIIEALEEGRIADVRFYVSLVKKQEKKIRDTKDKIGKILAKYAKEEYDPSKIYDILTQKHGNHDSNSN